MNLYKALNHDLTSPFNNFKWELGNWYTCQDFDPDISVDCSKGFYATPIEGITYAYRHLSNDLYEVEVDGRSVVINEFKQRFEKMKIVRKLDQNEIKAMIKQVDTGYNLVEAVFPVNPLLMKQPKNVDYKQLLVNWASVWNSVKASVKASVWYSAWDPVKDSVGASVWNSVGNFVWNSVKASVKASVGASVWDSVGAPVKASVWYSAWDSVWDFVGAYISSLFPNIKNWEYIDYDEGTNPFQPCIDLWRGGYVTSYDGTTWRLHVGKKAEVIYEMKS